MQIDELASMAREARVSRRSSVEQDTTLLAEVCDSLGRVVDVVAEQKPIAGHKAGEHAEWNRTYSDDRMVAVYDVGQFRSFPSNCQSTGYDGTVLWLSEHGEWFLVTEHGMWTLDGEVQYMRDLALLSDGEVVRRWGFDQVARSLLHALEALIAERPDAAYLACHLRNVREALDAGL